MTKAERKESFDRCVAMIREHAVEWSAKNLSQKKAFDIEGHRWIGKLRWPRAIEIANCGWRGFVRPEAKPRSTRVYGGGTSEKGQ